MSRSKLSEAEAYIMECFWEKGEMKTDALSVLVADRNWKPTTLLTFLSRLASKGMLEIEKHGKSNLYRPIMAKDEYLKSEGRNFLNDMYGGSARNFLAAMVDSNGLSSQDLTDLKNWFAQQEMPNG